MNQNDLQKIFRAQQASIHKFHEKSVSDILTIARHIFNAIKAGNKVLLFGNGGSAADAQHVAAEIVGRFARDRTPYPAIALTTDTSIITSVGNDYGFDEIFTRQIRALAKPGDIAVGISTSGGSPNVVKAVEWAVDNEVITIGFTGESGGKLKSICEISFMAPSNVTARIQEIHIMAWHAICELVENELVNSVKGG